MCGLHHFTGLKATEVGYDLRFGTERDLADKWQKYNLPVVVQIEQFGQVTGKQADKAGFLKG